MSGVVVQDMGFVVDSLRTLLAASGATVIRSIQNVSIDVVVDRGVGAAGSNTATITAVDTAKAVVLFRGVRGPGATGALNNLAEGTIVLTNATTVTANVVVNSTNSSGSITITVQATVLEFI